MFIARKKGMSAKVVDRNLVINDNVYHMKEVLYEVRCLKSNEDMILALAGQYKQLSREPEKFR